jgi:hypothetical protein
MPTIGTYDDLVNDILREWCLCRLQDWLLSQAGEEKAVVISIDMPAVIKIAILPVGRAALAEAAHAVASDRLRHLLILPRRARGHRIPPCFMKTLVFGVQFCHRRGRWFYEQATASRIGGLWARG